MLAVTAAGWNDVPAGTVVVVVLVVVLVVDGATVVVVLVVVGVVVVVVGETSAAGVIVVTGAAAAVVVVLVVVLDVVVVAATVTEAVTEASNETSASDEEVWNTATASVFDPFSSEDTGREKLRYWDSAAPDLAAAAAVPPQFMLSLTALAPLKYTTAPSSATIDSVRAVTFVRSATVK